eukprot:RCo031210
MATPTDGASATRAFPAPSRLNILDADEFAAGSPELSAMEQWRRVQRAYDSEVGEEETRFEAVYADWAPQAFHPEFAQFLKQTVTTAERAYETDNDALVPLYQPEQPTSPPRVPSLGSFGLPLSSFSTVNLELDEEVTRAKLEFAVSRAHLALAQHGRLLLLLSLQG